MNNLLKSKTAATREKRLQATAACYIAPDALAGESAGEPLARRIRTFSQDAPGDVHYALKVIASMCDVATVVHGADGCATFPGANCTVTHLSERDSIMGGDAVLREAVRQAHGLYCPDVIFIVSTPLVAVNNDDIEAVAEALKDELDIPVVPVYTDGFRSGTGVTGYDALAHAILKHVPLSRSKGHPAGVNLLSVSENKADRKEVRRLLLALGLSVNVFPQGASPDSIRRLPDAAFSLSIAPGGADYPGTALKERFGIPFVKPPIPVGIAGTEAWLTEIGRHAGVQEEAGKLIDCEKKAIAGFLSSRRPGRRRIFLNLPPAMAFGVCDVLHELEHEVAGLKTAYLDISHLPQLEKFRREHPGCCLSVGDGQVFEEENILRELRPDLYIGWDGDFSAAIRNGIPALNLARVPVLGFSGVACLARKIDRTLNCPAFAQRLARIETQTCTGQWLKRRPDWYIKQEVK
jgi:nitrogenase molybdenum-iron protein alpha chain